jgi:hypothetical protein
MAAIDIPCANQQCDSEDVYLVSSCEHGNGFRHSLRCNACSTRFELLTEITDIRVGGSDYPTKMTLKKEV